jgi:uncharacterized protein (DUF427 family)
MEAHASWPSHNAIEVEGELNRDAAWYYPEPKDVDCGGRLPAEFAGRYAFSHDVTVEP